MQQEGHSDPNTLHGAGNAAIKKIVLKCGDAFSISDVCGDLLASEVETGFYWQGTRFLHGCDLTLAGRPLTPLSSSISDEGDNAQMDLCNAYLTMPSGQSVAQGVIHVRRWVELHERGMTQNLTLSNFDLEAHTLRLGLDLSADFRDIFEVRGMTRPLRGEPLATEVDRGLIAFRYRGLDEVTRTTRLAFSPLASVVTPYSAYWDLTLVPGTSLQIQITIDIVSDEAGDDTSEKRPSALTLPKIESTNVFFDRLLSRGMYDLEMMCATTPEGIYPYAGIPWFACPFGRDGLLTSLEFLPWFPEVARGTLAFLAAHQGRKIDPFTEEEPGRILHEFRRGEMANCREIPFIPYYGTIDATPLFLITLESYLRWTNDLAFIERLWPQAEAAARWLVDYGDRDGDGFLEYERTAESGLINQGWKDSWDAITHQDGRLAPQPIALCEVQGYAYAAYAATAYLAERLQKFEEVARWQERARDIRMKFIERFWWSEEQVCFLALDGDKEPCRVVSSNAGQCLWTGILPEPWAEQMVARLMRDDMYSGWGIRTVSSRSARYNPMSYHNGSVWPHDTALIGAGFARYGHRQEAGKLLENLFGVSLYADRARLPELLCGFARHLDRGPTPYPVACSPQAWAAGAPFLLLSAVIGFHPNAEQRRLILHAPTLPDSLRELDLGGIRLGNETVRLRFVRARYGTAVTLAEESSIDLHVLSR